MTPQTFFLIMLAVFCAHLLRVVFLAAIWTFRDRRMGFTSDRSAFADFLEKAYLCL